MLHCVRRLKEPYERLHMIEEVVEMTRLGGLPEADDESCILPHICPLRIPVNATMHSLVKMLLAKNDDSKDDELYRGQTAGGTPLPWKAMALTLFVFMIYMLCKTFALEYFWYRFLAASR